MEKYIDLLSLFFSFVKTGKIKVRIMFRANEDLPTDFTVRTDEEKYFKLYYQFIKHAFGFKYMPGESNPTFVRIYLDQLPDKKEKCAKFKSYLMNLPHTKDFSASPFTIRDGDIAEICSHDHVLLQCTDIILGAMYFRLNNMHLSKKKGQHTRGKRTIAKDKLYKYIYSQIKEICPHFNIGISTGSGSEEYPFCYWTHPYRHWRFVSK